jgi:hypothetical protein
MNPSGDLSMARFTPTPVYRATGVDTFAFMGTGRTSDHLDRAAR